MIQNQHELVFCKVDETTNDKMATNSAHKRATDKNGVPKEAQDNGLSASISYGRQTPPRRPSGQKGDISHAQWDISRQKNGDN